MGQLAADYQVIVSPALDIPDYAITRARYLAALREQYGILQTHAFTAPAQDEWVGVARQLPLRLFEHACGRGQYTRSVADLLRFVDDWFAEWCPSADLPPRFLADHIRTGRA